MCKNGPKSDNPLGSGFYFIFLQDLCDAFCSQRCFKGALSDNLAINPE